MSVCVRACTCTCVCVCDARFFNFNQVNVGDELALFRLHFQGPLPASRQVGSGCYGTVYAVEVDGVQCIAKRVQDILLGEEGHENVGGDQRRAMQLKFRQECILLSKIRHPNIVQFMGVRYGQDMYDLTLVMERLPMDLQKCLEKCNADKFFIPLSIRFSILLDVTYGLLHLHNRSILHRDLTAGNILLTSSMRAKIADLGVSRIVESRHSQKLSTLPGTIGYMPPEALQDEPEYNLKLDIFSFGVLALFVALQQFPNFSWHRAPEAIAVKEEAELYKRRKWISTIGEQHYLYPLIHQCLQDNSVARPSTIELNAMLKELGTKFPRRLQDINKMLTQLNKLGISDIAP